MKTRDRIALSFILFVIAWGFAVVQYTLSPVPVPSIFLVVLSTALIITAATIVPRLNKIKFPDDTK